MFIRTKNLVRRSFLSKIKTTNKPLTCAGTARIWEAAAIPLLAAGIFGGLLAAPSAAVAQSIPIWTPWISGPLPRSSTAMAYDSIRNVTVMFGGSDLPNSGYTNETWEWNGVVWTLRQPTSGSPMPRNRMAMAFDSARGQVVMFGGYTGSFTDQTWVWTGSAWQAKAPFPSNPKPQPRANAGMAFDAERGNTVLFGGLLGGSLPAGDTWIWDGTNWSSRYAPGPSPRTGHQMVYDSARRVVVLFGGDSVVPPNNLNNELWEWNGSSWSQRTITGPSPSPRSRHTLTYDTARAKIVMFGGRTSTTGSPMDDTWEFDGGSGTWTQKFGQNPGRRSDHAAAYDIRNNATFTFGGLADPGISGTMWGYGEPCLAPFVVLQDFAQTLCPGNTASLGVIVEGSAPLSYQWRKAGVTIPAEVNASAITATLILPNITDNDSGLYDCIVTNGCTVITSSPARVTARSPADISGGGIDGNQPDGIVDGSDFIAFINAFAAGC